MDYEAAKAALDDVERVAASVRRETRWPVAPLIAWGVATLVAEPLITLMPVPWLFVPTVALVLVAMWIAVRGVRQRAHRHGFAWRYSACVAAWAVLHQAYLAVGLATDRNLTVALIGAPVVAAPLFLAAYLELRGSR